MSNYIISNNTYVNDKEIIIKGKRVPSFPRKGKNITVINNKVFIDGYEFKNGKWRRTLKALFHLIF